MLRIARFEMKCRAPAGREDVYALASSVAREQLATELSAFLGPSLSRQPGFVRIRLLRVRLVVRSSAVDRGQLLDGWVRAITRQLFTALAYPAGGGQFEIQRSPSGAHFRAEFIAALLAGTAPGNWAYRQYARILALPRAEAVMAVLREDPAELLDLLDALEAVGSFEAALALPGEAELEELFRAIATQPGIPGGFAPADFADIARILERHPPIRGLSLEGRAQALRLFVLARREGVLPGPRAWHAALAALRMLSENAALWWASPLTVEQICGRPLPAAVAELLELLRAAPSARPHVLAALAAAGLPRPASAASAASEPWRELDRASLLLLAGAVLRLDWHREWQSDPRGFQCFLYGVAAAVRGSFNAAVPFADPDAALFAGIFGEPSLEALRRFFAADSRAARIPESADALLAWFTARVPGFRRAAPEAIVRQFLSSPGRVRVEEQRVLVHLAANPVFLAVHIASLDEPLERVPWFDNRKLEFRIEGL